MDKDHYGCYYSLGLGSLGRDSPVVVVVESGLVVRVVGTHLGLAPQVDRIDDLYPYRLDYHIVDPSLVVVEGRKMVARRKSRDKRRLEDHYYWRHYLEHSNHRHNHHPSRAFGVVLVAHPSQAFVEVLVVHPSQAFGVGRVDSCDDSQMW